MKNETLSPKTTEMPRNIRFAGTDDLPGLIFIEEESRGSWNPMIFESELKNSFSRTIVCEEAGRITAFAVIWIVADEIQLQRICVLPEARNAGQGGLLVEYIKEGFPGKKITLEVAEKNASALALYSRAGFIKTGIRQNYYPDDHALLMDFKL